MSFFSAMTTARFSRLSIFAARSRAGSDGPSLTRAQEPGWRVVRARANDPGTGRRDGEGPGVCRRGRLQVLQAARLIYLRGEHMFAKMLRHVGRDGAGSASRSG